MVKIQHKLQISSTSTKEITTEEYLRQLKTGKCFGKVNIFFVITFCLILESL